jgi:exosortase B
MDTAATQGGQPARSFSVPWALAASSFLIIYAPLYYAASQDIWKREEHAHGAMILMIVAWLLFQKRSELAAMKPTQSASLLGFSLFAAGGLMYLLGRAAHFSIFEFGSQLPVIMGALLLVGGHTALKTCWFPVFFLVFMIPLPNSLIDQLTGPLKQWAAVVAEHVLYAMDYPVARTGVMLTVGHYKLQVADACAGLHSMFTLTAMGMLYMHMRQRGGILRNALLLLAILPIAFVANAVRVLALVLITYHFGDEAGQGFMHGTAGILLIVSALLALIALDSLLSMASAARTSPQRA